MNASRLLSVGCYVLLLLSAPLWAQVSRAVDIHVNENGTGSVTFPPAGVIVGFNALGNAVDPFDSTNGLTPLVYDLSAGPSLGGATPVPGDVLVTEPNDAAISDLLRFTSQGDLVVYSGFSVAGDPNHELADVGIPASRQTNQLMLSETNLGPGVDELSGYTPTPDQPGYLTSSAAILSVTYTFTSDVPEPATMGFIGLGILALRRRRAVDHCG